MDNTTPADAERHVAALATELTTPDDAECVLCFAARMLERFRCDGSLRWARRWRDLVRPGATALERRLEARGGFCDCEIFWNGWDLRADLLVTDEDGDANWPDVLPSCMGGSSRSAQPCRLWEPRRRGGRW